METGPSEDYNQGMARGWESKAVEAQIEAASIEPSGTRRSPTPQEQQLAKRKADLVLSRKHVLQQLSASGNERYSEMLRRSLADLDRDIEALG
jgi:hypothetical protein